MLSETMAEIAALGAAQSASKARAMIYDVKAKELLAWLRGFPLDTYHLMPYHDWVDERG